MFPAIDFEIDTLEAGPYAWNWSISWDAKTSGLRESAKRGALLRKFSDKGTFSSAETKWRADVGKVLGASSAWRSWRARKSSCEPSW